MAPDVSLLERWVRERDAEAFSELVSRYSGLVYGTSRRILGDAVEAEDVAQEAFIELATRGRAITTSISAWLHKAATHRALNRLRANRRRQSRERQYHQQSEFSGEAVWEEVWQHVDEAVAALPDKYREPIVMRFIDGRTQDFIARELDLAPATVRYRIGRGVEEVRKGLRKKGVMISVVGLGAALTGMESSAAPAGLTAVLGKLALTGLTSNPAGVGAGKLALAGGVAMTAKKTAVAVCAVVLLIGLGVVMMKRQEPQAPPSIGATAPAPEQKPAADVPERPAPAAPAAATAALQEPAELDKAAPAVEPASLKGVVQTAAGEPIGGATVYVEVLKGGEDLEVEKTYSAATGVDGRYLIDGIDTLGSPYAIMSAYASARGYLMEKHRKTGIVAGAATEKNFSLKEAQFIVAGSVVAQDRRPLPDASVELQYYAYTPEGLQETADSGVTTGNIGDCRFVFARTDESGRFELAIPMEGLCDFTVRKDAYGAGFFPQIPTGTQDALFMLRAPGGISGRVKTADGQPAPNVPVEIIGAGFPGGLSPENVWVQPLLLKTVRTKSGEDGAYSAEGLGEDYWYRVAVPGPGVWGNGEQKLLAQVMGVRVEAGKTTGGVDLVLAGKDDETVIFGKVTDVASGEPVYPMAVDVEPVKSDPLHGLAEPVYSSVDTNGEFRIVLNLMGECDVICRHRYETEGGGVWWDPEGRAVRIKPNQQVEVNFSVPAPFDVELEYVDEAGAPLAGIMTAMRRAERSGGCGGSMVSDAEGRATMHGLPPGMPLVAMGWQRLKGNLFTIGASEPFTGTSGKTVTGVRVVCRPITGFGGVSGTLYWPDGKPVAQTTIYCRTNWGNKEILEEIGVSGADGTFTGDYVLPEGAYAQLGVGFQDEQGRIFGAILNDVTIVNAQATPLGALTVAEVPAQ